MKECFPVPGFGISQIDDANELSRRTVVSQKLVHVRVLEAGVRAGLPIRGNRRIAIRVVDSGCSPFNINSGHLLLHALCSTVFRSQGTPFQMASLSAEGVRGRDLDYVRLHRGAKSGAKNGGDRERAMLV